MRSWSVSTSSRTSPSSKPRTTTAEARWDANHEWMDIRFRAREAHTVSIRVLELDAAFEAGEPLRVEVSSKFRREPFEREVEQAGLRLESWWTDPAGDFALALIRRESR